MYALAAGRYRLREIVGRGGTGEVWRAEDTSLQREVAVKLLREAAAGPEAVERFRQEALTAARLNHPRLLAVHDFGVEEGRGYLVMEFVPGPSLRDALAARGGPLAIEEACRLVRQTAQGLDAAHRAGVVHRDVKPGNLLLAEDGVKVADFGIAQVSGAAGTTLPTTGEVVGTGAYLAPERGLGRPAEPGADVYALGCVLHELLCGRTPFTGDDPAAVVYQHVHTPPPAPRRLRAEVPAEVEQLVLAMLAKKPGNRPTAGEVAHRLGALGKAPGAPGREGAAGREGVAGAPAAASADGPSGTGRPVPSVAGVAPSPGGPLPEEDTAPVPAAGRPPSHRRRRRGRRGPVLAGSVAAAVLALSLLAVSRLAGGDGTGPSPADPVAPVTPSLPGGPLPGGTGESGAPAAGGSATPGAGESPAAEPAATTSPGAAEDDEDPAPGATATDGSAAPSPSGAVAASPSEPEDEPGGPPGDPKGKPFQTGPEEPPGKADR
ncbi:serine/threonine-protein kinase [Streptomyces sp. JJ36]|uniref:serine/threonine-protein kinase n=1 Tax=Streptomyces sp. JJ36 TaxID=2736645 RepID=UPI001F02523F|nr:serine/threonine-protein kinase [Streptomyces sp. JJ36]MCF6524251.1 protein kinase [Streptomyces sp. JJ36]